LAGQNARDVSDGSIQIRLIDDISFARSFTKEFDDVAGKGRFPYPSQDFDLTNGPNILRV